jgi:hypothetical protein
MPETVFSTAYMDKSNEFLNLKEPDHGKRHSVVLRNSQGFDKKNFDSEPAILL